MRKAERFISLFPYHALMVASSLAVAACNTAPDTYLTDEKAPGARGYFTHPGDEACDEWGTNSDPWIDGYQLCGTENAIVPIDDPVMVPCNEAELADIEELFWVFDGIRARAYPLYYLEGRELVHDVFGDVPVLVDW